jgi:hypothetical protein
MGDLKWAVLILLLGATSVATGGFLWIEYTVPGVWPPWIGPPEPSHGLQEVDASGSFPRPR